MYIERELLLQRYSENTVISQVCILTGVVLSALLFLRVSGLRL